MNAIKRVWQCAVTGLSIIALTVGVQAQERADDPFGAAPGAAAPGPEKSLLAAGAAPPIDYGKALQYCQCVGQSQSSSVQKIEKALKSSLSAGLDFTEAALNDVIAQLQEEYGIPIQIDAAALEAIGTRIDEQITIKLHNTSLRSALRLMLKNVQLTYIIQDEVLMITTPEEAEKKLVTCVYDVRDLAETSKQPPMPKNGASAQADYNPLIDAITNCIAAETWSDNGGGTAEIRDLRPGLLVISQTAAVHEQICDLLMTIRNIKAEPAAIENPVAKSAEVAAALPPGEVVTRSYILQLDLENDPKAMRSEVRELLIASLPDETWTGRLADGQAVALSVIQDRVIVRQTPAVQEKVQKILADSGIATPAGANVADSGGGGGGFGGGTGGGGFGGTGGGGGGFFRPSLENAAPEPGSDDPFDK